MRGSETNRGSSGGELNDWDCEGGKAKWDTNSLAEHWQALNVRTRTAMSRGAAVPSEAYTF